MPSSLVNNCDVLVVGGGHAAMCAAISAAREGAQVVVLEAAPRDMRGGNSRHTRNLRAAHVAPTSTLVESYSVEEYWQDISRVTAGNTNPDLARLMIERSFELIEWLEQCGVRFQQALSGTLSLARTNAFFLGGGKALLNAEYRAAEALGVNIIYEAQVKSLDLNAANDTCHSVQFEHAGAEHAISVGAVVVASGGFQANEAWMREAWGEAADNFLIRGTPYNRGVVLRDLIDKGADTVSDPTQCHAVAIDARAPKYDGGIVSRLDCVCFSVVVNQEGARFYDEGEDFWPKRYAIWGRLVAGQPQQIAYAVIDAQVRDQFMPSVFPAIEASTLTDLASKLGIDSAALQSTIATFNQSIEPPSADDKYDPSVLDGCKTIGLQPPKSNWAKAIDTAPFYAYPLRPGISFTYLGLEVDHTARISIRGRSTSNVFAAGEVMAGNILGQGYCAGTGMTVGGVFGRIAGEGAAEVSRTFSRHAHNV